jgi:hypothetical protein
MAWELGKPTGIMCVDFAKAFDSVEHKMIQNVLKFFGFGNVMTSMVMTLLKDRKARIILDGGYSEDIIIGRGTPQGDRSSPYVFILCIEILLMKINLMDGCGVDDSGLYTGIANVNAEKPTSETYADDLTLIFKMENKNVSSILEMLRTFGQVSGLKINIDKTQLMVVGSDIWTTGTQVHGIEIVDKVSILGIKIDRKLVKLGENWEAAILKMQRLSGYWKSFSLSVTGRVMVAKTYIMSQCIYLMGSLPLGEEMGNRTNEVLLEFVRGSDRLIERRRQLLCSRLGGYGLLNANVMNLCMKATWIERWKRELPKLDYMAAIMWNGENEYDTWRLNTEGVRGTGMLLMEDIFSAWNTFKAKFYEWGNNINKAELFGNEVLLGVDEGVEHRVFSREKYEQVKDNVRGKTIGEITNGDGLIVSKTQVERALGIRLSWAEYFRLRTEVIAILERFPRKVEGICTEQSLDEFTSRNKKGCKRYRKIMEGKYSIAFISNNPMTIAPGRTLWGNHLDTMGRDLVEANYGLWSKATLDAGYKDFLFKMVHGKLYLNNQLANFADVERKCTFCSVNEKRIMKRENVRVDSPEYVLRISNLSNETSTHMMWDCGWVNNIVQWTFNRLCGTVNRVVDKDRYMGGWPMDNKKNQEVVLILIHYVKYVLYTCRNRRVVPSNVHMRYELDELMGMLIKKSYWNIALNDIGNIMLEILAD